MKKKFKYIFNYLFRGKGKLSFLSKLPKDSSILDIGCGNIQNAIDVKSILFNSKYTGIDVYDYNSKSEFFHYIDKYIISNKRDFSESISSLADDSYDAVISSHNLEHCYDNSNVLKEMCKKVKKGGSIFLSFPCQKSISFPSRNGTLNYHDDETHQGTPPDPDQVISILKEFDFEISYFIKEYKPFFLYLFGFIVNIVSKYRNKVMIGIWEYYGFETIIHAKKK